MKRALPFTLLLTLAAAAHADDAAPRCTYVEVADLPIRYAGPSLVPAVDGSINDTPATMLVDTGSDQTHLTMNAATRRDLLLSMTGRWVDGIGGSSRIYATRLKEMGVGPAKLTRRIELTVIGSTTFTPAFDAIIGAPFLLQTDLEFDLRAKHMKFYRPKDCGKTPLILWKEDTVDLPFRSSWSKSPNPHFTVVVNGKELDAMIDTGAHDSFLTLDAAQRAGIDVKGGGARSTGYAGGIGTERAAAWVAPVKTVQFGGETIRDVELSVVDVQGMSGPELFLGQDFLRAHRVLFAMSQEKVYIAYLGGDVFAHGSGIEPWIRAEAENGNGDAQYVLASRYGNGAGVPRDPAQARAWLDKAAAQGEPHANLALGRQQMLAGHVADAIPKLKSALDQLPSDRIGPLWLYAARVRNGEAELARTELQAALKRQKEDDWPEPIAEFYLGEMDATHVLDAAAREPKFAHGRTCLANSLMSEWYAARGDQSQADSLRATVRAHCVAAPAPKPAARPAPAATPAPSTATTPAPAPVPDPMGGAVPLGTGF